MAERHVACPSCNRPPGGVHLADCPRYRPNLARRREERLLAATGKLQTDPSKSFKQMLRQAAKERT